MAGAGFNSPAMCLSAFSYLPSMDMSALLLGKPIITEHVEHAPKGLHNPFC